MTHRLLPAAAILLLLCVSLVPARSEGSESNEAFVREHLKDYFLEVIDSLKLPSSSEVTIDYEPPAFDKLDVSGAALSDAMETKGLRRRRTDDAESGGRRIDLTLSRLEFQYENRHCTPFSRGDLYRVLQVAGSFSILQGNSVLDEDFLVKKYEGQIRLDEREDIEDESSPMFHADLPSGPVQRFWEPVIVTSIIGGLVYLFFASR